MDDERVQSGPDWVLIYTAPDEVTAELVRGTLEAEDIPAVITQRVLSAYAPVFQAAEGAWGTIAVPVTHETRARSLLAAFDTNAGAVSAEELEAASVAFPAPADGPGQ